MKLASKCFVVALSALFAATPVVPAGAMPLGVTKAQPASTAGQGNVQLVIDGQQGGRSLHLAPDDARIWRYRDRGRNWDRGRDVRRWDRRDARRWDRRDVRRWDRRDVRRWDRRDRYGWYRGHRGYRYARPGYRYHDGFWFPLAAFGAGVAIGSVVTPQRGYVGGDAHTRWCANRYVSYRPYDNTFQPYNGPRRQCISPYS